MIYKLTAHTNIAGIPLEFTQTFTFWFTAKKAIKVALESGYKVTVESENIQPTINGKELQ